jgi:hypothetical protein
MTIELDDRLITNLARETLAEVAPNELESFPAISKAYFRNPEKVLEKTETDKPLGSGTVIGEAILIPVLLWLANKLVDLVWDIVKKPLEDALSDPVSRFIKRLLNKLGLVKKVRPKTLPKLTLFELQVVREKLLTDPNLPRLARSYNLSNEQMSQLIDRMMNNFANKL